MIAIRDDILLKHVIAIDIWKVGIVLAQGATWSCVRNYHPSIIVRRAV
jgi:hypothetical protein